MWNAFILVNATTWASAPSPVLSTQILPGLSLQPVVCSHRLPVFWRLPAPGTEQGLVRGWRRKGRSGAAGLLQGWSVAGCTDGKSIWVSSSGCGHAVPCALAPGVVLMQAGGAILHLSAKSWHNSVWQPQERLPGLGLRRSFLSFSLPEETLKALQRGCGRWLASCHLKWPPWLLSYCFCLLHFYVVTVHHRTKGVRPGRAPLVLKLLLKLPWYILALKGLWQRFLFSPGLYSKAYLLVS